MVVTMMTPAVVSVSTPIIIRKCCGRKQYGYRRQLNQIKCFFHGIIPNLVIVNVIKWSLFVLISGRHFTD
jgi:hypothetical protein